MQKMVILLFIACGVMWVGVYPMQAIVERGLIGYWSFDACDIRDDSGNGHRGTRVNNVSCVQGIFGMAVAFDRDNEYVEVPTLQAPRNAFTYALWFKPDQNLNADRGRQDLLYGAQDNDFFRPHITFNFNKEGRLTLLVRLDGERYDEVYTSTRRWNANTWYHLAFTWTGSRFRVYVNGRQEREVQQSGQSSSPKGFVLGIRSRDLKFSFEGSLDEVAIYNRALSADEVALLVMPEPPDLPAVGGVFCLIPLSQFFQLCDELVSRKFSRYGGKCFAP